MVEARTRPGAEEGRRNLLEEAEGEWEGVQKVRGEEASTGPPSIRLSRYHPCRRCETVGRKKWVKETARSRRGISNFYGGRPGTMRSHVHIYLLIRMEKTEEIQVTGHKQIIIYLALPRH